MMHNKILTVLLLIVSSGIQAQEKIALTDVSEFRKRMEERSIQINSIVADFSEEKKLIAFKEPKLSAGIFYYRKKDKIRWQINSPQTYCLLINGAVSKVFENGKSRDVASASRMINYIKDLMTTLIDGNFFENKSFQTGFFENSAVYFVDLTPASGNLKNAFEKIELQFSKEALSLKQMLFVAKNGDRSTMVFTNEKFNTDIDEEVFNNL